MAMEQEFQNLLTTQAQRHLPRFITERGDCMEAPESVHPVAVGGVFQYVSTVINDDLMLLEFKMLLMEGRWSKDSSLLESLLIAFLLCLA